MYHKTYKSLSKCHQSQICAVRGPLPRDLIEYVERTDPNNAQLTLRHENALDEGKTVAEGELRRQEGQLGVGEVFKSATAKVSASHLFGELFETSIDDEFLDAL